MIKYYDKTILDKLHQKELKILEYFISFCDKYDISYFIAFGTLIGAVRHQGFIPWDDDIDVGMLRDDYNRFLQLAQENPDDRFFVQSVKSDNKFHLPFTKIRLNGTKFVERGMENSEEHLGIFIDIFPFDNISDDIKESAKQIKKAEFLQKIYVASSIKCPQIGNRKGLSKIISKIAWYSIYYTVHILKINPEYIWKKYQKYTLMYQNIDTSRATCMVSSGQQGIIYKYELGQYCELPFENLKVKAPKNYDAILTRYYGDYMQLPPKDQQVNHCPSLIDFGE